MKRRTYVPLLALLLLACFGAAQAQDAAPATLRVAFVDTQALIRAHPANDEISRLSESLDQELSELIQQRRELAEKQQAEGLNAEEQELLQALNVTIETRRERGLSDIREAAAPAEEAANEVIREIAVEENFELVLDIEAASGLVVYADQDLPDITEQALAILEERFQTDAE
ncbi:MAG: OmpH family outer membrane protein [Trueperaceae bacterium]|nr:OmpH family outer membrane protein [Trueperaceae bacterium]